MLRLSSFVGLACLGLAAAAFLSVLETIPAESDRSEIEPKLPTYPRFRVILPGSLSFHAQFSLN